MTLKFQLAVTMVIRQQHDHHGQAGIALKASCLVAWWLGELRVADVISVRASAGAADHWFPMSKL